MDRFKLAETLQKIINDSNEIEVIDYDDDNAELIVKAGKKKFIVQIKEI